MVYSYYNLTVNPNLAIYFWYPLNLIDEGFNSQFNLFFSDINLLDDSHSYEFETNLNHQHF